MSSRSITRDALLLNHYLLPAMLQNKYMEADGIEDSSSCACCLNTRPYFVALLSETMYPETPAPTGTNGSATPDISIICDRLAEKLPHQLSIWQPVMLYLRPATICLECIQLPLASPWTRVIPYLCHQESRMGKWQPVYQKRFRCPRKQPVYH
jgi:hypothetical protein